jgi:hypothetical protein
MSQHPRLAERLRAALPAQVRRPRHSRADVPATTAPVEAADAGEQFALRLRAALPERRRRPRVTTPSGL